MTEPAPIPGIPCPSCQSHRHSVIDSRPRENTTMRRRKCKQCGERFSTFEFSEADVPSMTRQPRDALRTMRTLAMRMIGRADAELRDE